MDSALIRSRMFSDMMQDTRFFGENGKLAIASSILHQKRPYCVFRPPWGLRSN